MEPSSRSASAAVLIHAGLAEPGSRLVRHLLSNQGWANLVDRLAIDPLPLSGLWSDGEHVHALFVEGFDTPLIASVAVEQRRFLALSGVRPSAIIPERVVRDLWGIEAMEARDLRPWLDHGSWGLTAPLTERPGPASWPPEPPEFVWTEADQAAGAFQCPVGPVQTLFIGPAQVRLTIEGERIRRIETLFGSAHRGIAHRLRGQSPERGAFLIARIDATASVAHQIAFANAVEMAVGLPIGPDTGALRCAMLALERIAMQLHHLAGLASLSGQRTAAGQASALRNALLERYRAAFGHRMMMDSISPGGWLRLPDRDGIDALPILLDRLRAELPALRSRLVDKELVGRFASLEDDLGLARQCGHAAPNQPWIMRDGLCEGIGMAMSVQGPVWHWLRMRDGLIVASHAVDPNLGQLATLERQAIGLPVDRLAWLCAMHGISVAGGDQ
jgi:hypothetical protein